VHINWGSSYIANDLYRRFMHKSASQKELVLVGRLSSVMLAALASVVAFYATDIGKIFTFMIAIGTGPGAVLILRWFWSRVNAWAEIAAMVAGLLIALFLSTPTVDWAWTSGLASMAKPVSDLGPGGVLPVTAFGSAIIWLIVMYATKPESDEKLDEFYRRVRPGGPGWKRQRERTGYPPLQDLRGDLLATVLGIGVIFGLMFAVGGLVLAMWNKFFISAVIAAVCGFLLQRVRRTEHAARVGRKDVDDRHKATR
jgi:hypothetical protein